MKINTLDLTKTISDFLFLWVKNPEEKARIIFEIKHTLTAHWFEKYIQYYFQKYKKYKVKLNWRTNEFDNWIDLKWVKYEDGKNYFLLVQCKKFAIKDITEDLIANFYWKIIDKVINLKDNIEIFYITTSKFTDKARKFWKEKWIKIIDFYDIYKLQEIYPLENFKYEILKNEWQKEIRKCFCDNQLILKLYDNHFNIESPSDSELYQFLKQIRRDYSYKNQLRLWDIARNETLELLAKKRPYNLQSLKDTIRTLSSKERNKILKYWDIFIERLKYLEIKEK
jgi:hypothetical protein